MSAQNKADSSKSVIINSVDRSINVLEYLYKAGGETSVSQISKDLDIYKSTVFRTLATLENRGYVVQNKLTELYSIGPKLYAYSAVNHNHIIAESIRPYLKKLSDQYRETVTYGILTTDFDGIYSIENILAIQSRHNLGIISGGGANQRECYCASLGKCLLAFGEDLNLSVYKRSKMVKFTENTITNYTSFMKELDIVREQGYAVDDEEREIGLFCLGVPILNSRGHAVAAMSMSGPIDRIHDDHFEEKIEFMKALSKEISENVYL